MCLLYEESCDQLCLLYEESCDQLCLRYEESCNQLCLLYEESSNHIRLKTMSTIFEKLQLCLGHLDSECVDPRRVGFDLLDFGFLGSELLKSAEILGFRTLRS